MKKSFRLITAILLATLILSSLSGCLKPVEYTEKTYSSNDQYIYSNLISKKSGDKTITLNRAFCDIGSQCFYADVTFESSKLDVKELEKMYSNELSDLQLETNGRVFKGSLDSDEFLDEKYRCCFNFYLDKCIAVENAILRIDDTEFELKMKKIETSADALPLGKKSKIDSGVSFFVAKKSQFPLDWYFVIRTDQSVFEKAYLDNDSMYVDNEFYLENVKTKKKIPVDYDVVDEYAVIESGKTLYNAFSLSNPFDEIVDMSDYVLKYKCSVVASYDAKPNEAITLSADNREGEYKLFGNVKAVFKNFQIVENEGSKKKKMLKVEVTANEMDDVGIYDRLRVWLVDGDNINEMAWKHERNTDGTESNIYQIPIRGEKPQYSFCVSVDNVVASFDGEIQLN